MLLETVIRTGIAYPELKLEYLPELLPKQEPDERSMTPQFAHYKYRNVSARLRCLNIAKLA